LKTCRACKLPKNEETEFYKSTGNTCKVCHNERSKSWARANPEKVKATRKKSYHNPENRERYIGMTRAWQARNPDKVKKNGRRRNLKLYGLTEDQFDEMAEAQRYCCYLCGTDEVYPLEVDHSHKTGNVRKLLCNKCNTALGLLSDDPDLMRRAADYVVEFQ